MHGPFTSLQHDLKQVFESHGIQVESYNVQPRHGEGIDALWTIEGRHIGLKEQREDLTGDGQKIGLIAFPVDSHEEFEQIRMENKIPDETWFYVNNQGQKASELDSPINKLQRLASKDEKQSNKEAVELVKETLRELKAIKKSNSLDPGTGSKTVGTTGTGDLQGDRIED
jgi:hypothetical protein